ncbi:MAG: hypothetical protein IKP65_08060 [Alphaproteobacteria bacterium]|nr:hypothetical protein [Alphaproteobacteria bacterium]
MASTLDGWTQISGSSKDNGDGWSYSRTYEANGHRKDFNTYGTYYRGYALGICNEDLYYLDRFNAIKIDENVDCICGELRENQNGFYLKNNELYKIYFETEPIYYNEQIYYDEQEHKSYYASVQYGTSFVVKK